MDKVDDKNALHKAVAQKRLKLVRILLDGGTDPNCTSYDGKTPLMVACCFYRPGDNEAAQYDIIRHLLEYKAKPNVQDQHGQTALMYALYHSMPPNIIKMMIEHGCDPCIRDNRGMNAVAHVHSHAMPKYQDILRPYTKSTKTITCRYRTKSAQFNHTSFKRLTDQTNSASNDDIRVSKASQRNVETTNLSVLDRNRKFSSDIYIDKISETPQALLEILKTESERTQRTLHLSASIPCHMVLNCSNYNETKSGNASVECYQATHGSPENTNLDGDVILPYTMTDKTREDLTECEATTFKLKDGLTPTSNGLIPERLLRGKERSGSLMNNSLFPHVPKESLLRRRSCPDASKNLKKSMSRSNCSDDDLKKDTPPVSLVDLNILNCDHVKRLPKLPPIVIKVHKDN